MRGSLLVACLLVARGPAWGQTPAAQEPQAVPQATANSPQPLRLTPKREAGLPRLPQRGEPREGGGFHAPSPATLVGSLAVALGVFLLLAWAVRRHLPKAPGRLPSEVVEVLGQTALAGKQQLHLVRVGPKLLLVSASAGGLETLTEISEPAEVDRLAGLCQAQRPGSSTAAFQDLLSQLSRDEAWDDAPARSKRAFSGRRGEAGDA